MTNVEESPWRARRSLLQAKYEQVAWGLFAKYGFREVTIDEIPEAAGVSARTLFRYFPFKEDFLLGFARRGTEELVELITTLEPSQAPVQQVWRLLRDLSLSNPHDVRLLTKWRRAAADAPEIHARVRGERVHELTEALADYFGKTMGTSASDDPDPRLHAGFVVGISMAAIELWGRTELALPEILEAAEAAFPELTRKRRRRPS